MNLFSRQPKTIDAANDPLAIRIAGKVIRWQDHVSMRMNKMVGNYSLRRQAGILAAIIAVFAGAMVASLILQRGKSAPITSGSYVSRHIGEASNGQPPGEDTVLKTDSLTHRK
ncbi:hypothetical protein [Mucilaginibacter rubeus]|jgi:hypothetical protein|uniref:Uncharacterized protein n=1 Tax=Mucilaginibacter rubeus TaxID=2027860 RepID=A0A5C1I4U6_9SPHI|nr:hypothetical protein [Mucilaginibacter rubeus]QEM12418.1 hypothetical protein DEO27_021145 [Mucilaginibacter rubeus]